MGCCGGGYNHHNNNNSSNGTNNSISKFKWIFLAVLIAGSIYYFLK